jgi:hypothetical protein
MIPIGRQNKLSYRSLRMSFSDAKAKATVFSRSLPATRAYGSENPSLETRVGRLTFCANLRYRSLRPSFFDGLGRCANCLF